ncbi:hypothetical protein F5Y12DRAFT_765983 [Xylaria sp. FL1777]|nr:hypothetical protein F5Y12DRAFT_765983 [Xylaria sp. FL1777]
MRGYQGCVRRCWQPQDQIMAAVCRCYRSDMPGSVSGVLGTLGTFSFRIASRNKATCQAQDLLHVSDEVNLTISASSRVALPRKSFDHEVQLQQSQHPTWSRSTAPSYDWPADRRMDPKSRCLECDSFGHTYVNCYASYETVQRGRLNRMCSGRCCYCGKGDHWQADCPRKS